MKIILESHTQILNNSTLKYFQDDEVDVNNETRLKDDKISQTDFDDREIATLKEKVQTL